MYYLRGEFKKKHILYRCCTPCTSIVSIVKVQFGMIWNLPGDTTNVATATVANLMGEIY